MGISDPTTLNELTLKYVDLAAKRLLNGESAKEELQVLEQLIQRLLAMDGSRRQQVAEAKDDWTKLGQLCWHLR